MPLMRFFLGSNEVVMRRLLALLWCMLPFVAVAQNDFRGRFSRPLSEVISDVARRFDVRIDCRGFQADTVVLRYADFRVRPYSLEQTLDNICQPTDMKWSERKKGVYRIEPYEYHRRTVADGEQLLAWLSSLCANREQWESRREVLRQDVREVMNMEPWLAACVEREPIWGAEHRQNGYRVRNFALETLPGLYVAGSIYEPTKRGREESRSLIVAPSGHWEGGRLRSDHQYFMATLARMGAVVVDYDIFGWGDSELQVGKQAHAAYYGMQVQALWSLVVTDWILESRDDIDPQRVGVTGGSGGATHALLLALLDDRFTAAAPMVHLVSHFDGGCPCESGVAVSLAGGGSCMTELLATLAPRPVLTISDGGDWTRSYPELEYPFLQRVWRFYDSEDKVLNAHFGDEKHDVGESKRKALYEFFGEVFSLNVSEIDESKVEILPDEELRMFSDGVLPEGAIRSAEELESVIENL